MMELSETVVLSTRVRLARNFAAYPFPHRLFDEAVARTVIRTVYDALSGLDDFTLYRLAETDDETIKRLLENNLISPALLSHKSIAAAIVNAEETVSVMVNEEDHLREQCILPGSNVWGCYELLSGIDDEISKSAVLAYDEHFGYLTACPTNIGTGLRCSLMLFLPALTKNGLIPSLKEKMSRLGMVLRGAHGEGSEASGFLYQLSIEVTLGVSEMKILSEVNNVALKIIQFEGEERQNLFAADSLSLQDSALRAFGILTHCVLLSYEEMISLMADLKLGVALGIVKGDVPALEDLSGAMLDTNLVMREGKPLTERELKTKRAHYVKSALQDIIG
ncbi:MAG: ATP--guanido phosphotransferase [Clostridia bacterium]|nr:ATP--guanido phosphotransferase [Clostridia bacterium]